MADHVVDTNVLLVASAAHPYSPFDDTHVPAEGQQAVFAWLASFRADDDRRLVLDDAAQIFAEYRNKLTHQDYGLLVVLEKLSHARFAAIDVDRNGHARVPEEFERLDRSDRKFLAAALTDPAAISIVNAADSDWLEIERQLADAGVAVVHLLEAWLRARRRNRP